MAEENTVKMAEGTAEKKAKGTAEKKVKIKLPLTRSEKDAVFVGVNGKTYLIKRGETVEVPESVAEVLQHREDMLGIAMEFEARAAAPMDELEKK